MKNINEDLIKRSLLYMNYDSKKTLNENISNINLLMEDTTSAAYALKLKTSAPGGNSAKNMRISKGSTITQNGDLLVFDNPDVFFAYNCVDKTFKASSKSSFPAIKSMITGSIWTSDSKELDDLLVTKYCKNVVVDSGSKDGSGSKDNSAKKTDKSYVIRLRNDNTLKNAKSMHTVPGPARVGKNGDILTIGTFQYSCSKRIFAVGPGTDQLTSLGAVYENEDFAKYLDGNHCKTTSKTSSFDWMANGNNNYWQVLKTSLEKNDLVPYVKESSDAKQGSFYYWGKFIVWRNTPNKFITHGDTNVLGKISNYNGKYAGQTALSNIELTLSNGEKSDVLAFITKYSSTISGRDSGIQNDPGPKPNPKPDYTPGGGSKPKNECKGTYSMGCITPEVGEAQQCLKDDGLYPYRVDNKFGSKTRDAVKAKIGKTYFTDADLQTICKTTQGGGGEDEYDFDKDMGGGSGGQEKEDTTWTGDVY